MGKWFQNKSFSTEKQEQGIKARKGHRGINAPKMHRALGILLAAALVFQTVPFEGIAVSASESSGGGLCEHHTEHTPDCGYKEAEPGHECTHEHTKDCYRTVEEEDGSITKELDCHHEHDESCGYREAAEGSPCTFECEICKGGTDEIPEDNTEDNGINDGDSENPGTENGDETEEPDDGQEECTCEERCTEDSINTDCPVCGAEDASLSDCKGKDTEDSTEDAEENTDQPEDTGLCKHHQEHDDACGYLPESEDSEGSPCTYECHICPIEKLIAALPDAEDITEDNADDVRARLDEILALYRKLTEEEQEQIDLSRVYKLQGALDGANVPAPVEGEVSVDYQEATWDGSTVTYTPHTGQSCTPVADTTTEWNAGWYAVSGTVTISEPITVTGAVNLILTDGCVLNAAQGIVVTKNNSLTIYAQTGGTGTLNATGTTDDSGDASAGIGGSTSSFDSGSITIHGGVINATGGGQPYYYGGAGIGGGTSSSENGGNSGAVIIYSGTIIANSGAGNVAGAGIGGGGGGNGENGGDGSGITIYGGNVTAASHGTQSGGAGIGGGAGNMGDGGAGNNIQIYGGTVHATGGFLGAGIGGGGGAGATSGSGNVTIAGGKVTAVGGECAAGIGGGGGYQSTFGGGPTGGTGSVTISGGVVDASSPTDVGYADYKGAPIGNGGNQSTAATVNKENAIVFENGVGTVCGNVTFNSSYAVPAGYSLHIPTGASLSGSGTLSGGGKFTTENLTEDMISVPTNLYYDGTEKTVELQSDLSAEINKGIEICSQPFTVSGWTVAVEKTGDLTYTATYTNESDNTKNFTKTITLQKSGTDLTSDGKVLTYNGDTQTATFTADDTITVKATPTATGQAPTKAAARLRGNPTAGQMVVFVGDTQVSAPADVGEDGAYTMTVSAADVLAAAGGPGTGITLTAKFVGNDNMADGAGTVPVNISAVAKVENGSSTTYVGESGLDAAFAEDSGNSGAIFTLLANVTRAKVLTIKIDCDLDLGGHTITCTGNTAVGTLGSKNVTIRGTGEIISTNGTALDVWGNVTLAGGCFRNTGSDAAVSISYQGSLSVIDGNVTIQNTGGGYGLAVKNAQSQSVRLSAGKYSGTAGAISIVDGSLTLGDLLGHSGDTRYAYFDENGTNPFKGVLGDQSLTGTVTVKPCTHDKSVCEYTPNEGADTHAMTCRACGLEGAVEDCQLTYTSNETQHTAACETCGRSRTEAHSYGSWEPQHNGTAVTIRRVCESCGYTKTDGTFTVPAPGQTMKYGKPITLTCSSTLPDATFQWELKNDANMSTVQKSTGDSFTLPETLAVGRYNCEISVTWSGTGGNSITKRVPFEVTPAPLPDATLSPASAVYNGTAQKPAVAIDGLTEGTDYTVAYTGDFTNAGTHTVTVTGKGNYEGTVTKTFTIEKAEQTDFAFAAVTKPYEKNGTFTLSTGGGGNGAVLYRVPENNGVLMVNGDQATIIGVGTVTVTATKAESENYKAATATGTVTIRKANAPAITYPTAGSITYGQRLSDCALTGGSTEYGTFAWENGSTIPAVDNTGYTVVFTASEETKKNYETITNTTKSVSVKVEKAAPAVSVTAAVSGSKDNRQAVLTVNVAKAGAGAFPTGTVTFIDCTGSTEVKIGTATLSNGSASYTWDGLLDKTYTIKAVYTGNDNYTEAGSRELTFDAAKQNQQDFALDAIGAKTYGDAAITLKTTGGSGNGAVRYESSDENVIRIEDGRAVIAGAGTATITAIKEGDNNYNEASASRNVTVAKKALTVRADSKTVVRGNPMPALTYRADGLVNGDTFTAAPSITADVQNTDTLGKYDIVISGGTLQNSESYSITYVNGTLNIVERFYTVTVTDGTGGGEYAEGDTVTVTANERNGYTFTGWSSEYGVAFADSKAKTTTFTMPAKAVAVKANYTRNSSGGNNGGGSGDGGNSGGSGNNGGGNSGDNGNNGGGGSTNPGNGSTTPQPSVTQPTDTNTNPGNETAPGTGTTPVNPGTENTVRPGSSAEAPAQGTKQPFIKGADDKIGWDVIRAEEEQAQEGSTINVDMNGSTVVPGDIFDSIKGKDITITFDMGNGILWSVDGKSITADKTGDIDFSVKTGVNTVPVDIINNVTGESYSIQISLAHEGDFGFTAVLSIGLGKENAGYTASLYYYNESTGELEFICKDQIAEDGTVSLAFTHASDYVIAIDEKQEGGDGVAESAQPDGKDGTAGNGTAMEKPSQEGQQWRPWWLVVAGVLVLAMGVGVFFIRKKKGDED